MASLGKNRPDNGETADVSAESSQEGAKACRDNGACYNVEDGRISIEKLARHSRILLLQGPNGPFFARLSEVLQEHGSQVWKVNFNGGDDLFYRHGDVIRFTQPMSMWEKFLADLLVRLRIDAIVVFGGTRRHHRVAARVAKSKGIVFWVFEEGYVRPNYITLERDGVNADSPLAAIDLDDIPKVPTVDPTKNFRHSFVKMAWYSFCYFVAGMLSNFRYPNYRHHKAFGLHEAAFWIRAALRKWFYRLKERYIVRDLLSDEHPPFFLVALQVYNDSQIRVHSPWRRIEDFIEWTIHSFAYHAPHNTMLVIKHHPMDRGHTDYAPTIRKCASRYRVGARVVYVHDAHLPSLLHRCDGVVTINSTTGLQAMYHGVPVIALGRTFYAKEGLTYQGSLDDFWSKRASLDKRAYRRFLNYVIYFTQINSSFYADANLSDRSRDGIWQRRWITPSVCIVAMLTLDWIFGGELPLILSVVHRALGLLGA